MKPNRVEPDFRSVVVALHVNVGRLLAVASEEEESVRPSAENSWHELKLGATMGERHGAAV